MAFPQNTNLIFVYDKKVIHREPLSFETSGYGFMVMEKFIHQMRALSDEQSAKNLDPKTIINPDKIEAYIDENGVKRKVN